MSFCNQTINMSSPLSIIFTPTSLSYSSCCNITLIKPSLSKSSEQIIINIINLSERMSSFHIFNKKMQSIELINYSLFNRTYIKTDIMNLPLTFSLCQFNIQTFEILITNISKGKKQKKIFILLQKNFCLIGPCISNQYRCLINNQDQWCIDELLHCDGYHSCPQGIDEVACPSMNQTNLFFEIFFFF